MLVSQLNFCNSSCVMQMQWNPVLLLHFLCSEVLSEELKAGSVLLFRAQTVQSDFSCIR